MAFTAKDVQALREKTGCGMMDCKKALVETNGDMDAAVDFLREKVLHSRQRKLAVLLQRVQYLLLYLATLALLLSLTLRPTLLLTVIPLRSLLQRLQRLSQSRILQMLTHFLLAAITVLPLQI